MDLYRIGTFPVEISQGKVLLNLFEKGLYLPSATVYRYDRIRRHVKIVCQQGYEFRLFPFLDVHVCDDSGDMEAGVIDPSRNASGTSPNPFPEASTASSDFQGDLYRES